MQGIGEILHVLIFHFPSKYCYKKILISCDLLYSQKCGKFVPTAAFITQFSARFFINMHGHGTNEIKRFGHLKKLHMLQVMTKVQFFGEMQIFQRVTGRKRTRSGDIKRRL